MPLFLPLFFSMVPLLRNWQLWCRCLLDLIIPIHPQGFEMFCSQSFSKNFGLYNERAGNLSVVAREAGVVANFQAQITLIIRWAD